jgi:glycine/D-amino acid oxidase-like deaminating enzyme
MTRSQDLDVLVVGGGIAGLWVLDALRRAGYGALLVEKQAVGVGQTIQSQGVVHGGGKYTLRGPSVLEDEPTLARTLAGMPARWLACLEGEATPDLSMAKIRSRACLMWVPKQEPGDLLFKAPRSFASGGRLPAMLDVLPESEWPEALRGALEVRTMAELVVDMGSVVATLLAQHHEYVLRSPDVVLELHKGEVSLDGNALRPGAVVLAAGAGNEALLEQIGATPRRMQRRPLTMFLMRGSLPELYGHCVVEGMAHLTVTSVRPESGAVVWQIGGEIAERASGAIDLAAARTSAVADVCRCMPRLNLAGAEVGTYAAIRAEGATGGARRPSGLRIEHVHVEPAVLAVWPMKFTLAPLLAEQVVARLAAIVPATGTLPSRLPKGGEVRVAVPPWEEAEWFPVP